LKRFVGSPTTGSGRQCRFAGIAGGRFVRRDSNKKLRFAGVEWERRVGGSERVNESVGDKPKGVAGFDQLETAGRSNGLSGGSRP
jgi:hypothetical protein